MSEWLLWTFRPVLLLHVDGNVNLYVNVIQQTGYHHQSYLQHVEYSKIMPAWLSCRLCNINIHLFRSFYIMRIIVNSVHPIGVTIIMIVSEWRYDRESEGECHLIPEVSPCVSTQERPSQSWIVSFQRLGCTSCLNTITFSPCIHLTHTERPHQHLQGTFELTAQSGRALPRLDALQTHTHTYIKLCFTNEQVSAITYQIQ